MSYTIRKRFRFSASHQLDGLPEGHQCGRLHGHNYGVWLELARGELQDDGMLVDFGELATFSDFIDSALDHRHLNDVLPLQPTAENLAAYLYAVASAMWPEVEAVAVEETETCWAEYRP
jgi:6-pyruvoyltetrahydropterin/6-carboxytetrahydropterin synthase